MNDDFKEHVRAAVDILTARLTDDEPWKFTESRILEYKADPKVGANGIISGLMAISNEALTFIGSKFPELSPAVFLQTTAEMLAKDDAPPEAQE